MRPYFIVVFINDYTLYITVVTHRLWLPSLSREHTINCTAKILLVKYQLRVSSDLLMPFHSSAQ